MKQATGSNAKPSKHRCKKYCACGGHSTKDVKKNLNHNATKKKAAVRKTRKALEKWVTIQALDGSVVIPPHRIKEFLTKDQVETLKNTKYE